MRSITKVFNALATLANSLEGPAALVDIASSKLRQGWRIISPLGVR
jgi:hypothetical protein